MLQVGKQTVARCSGTLQGSSVKIHRCHYSYIYLLSPLRYDKSAICSLSCELMGNNIYQFLLIFSAVQ